MMLRVGQVVRVGAVAGIVSALCGCDRGLSDRDIQFVNYPELKKVLDADGKRERSRLALVDPRGKDDFEAGHLPGARRIGPLLHDGRVDPELVRAGEVIVYGENPASALGRGMTKRLMELGVSKVRFYAGGFEEWKRLEEPIEQGAGTKSISR